MPKHLLRRALTVRFLLFFLLACLANPAFASDKIGLDLEWRPITGIPKAPPPAPQSAAPGQTWTDPSEHGMEFVWAPGGCYQMGCGSWAGDCYDNEKPVHEVCLDGFWIGKYEVTQGQWEKMMGGNSSKFKGPNRPVEQVSWNDCQKFIDRLNGKRQGNYKFRLPTEAEWEYVCRNAAEADRPTNGAKA